MIRRNILLYIAITSLIFIARNLLFLSTQNVGIEHDSGWYLGVARNVAERGIYASYINDIASTENPGSHPSLFGRYSAQDRNGFIYFPAAVTVGPAYVFPQALILKLFGCGWMQFRVWPFMAFCFLIPLLFFIAYHVGSFFGLLFFQSWLWLYPQLLLSQSYEALSEHIGLLLLLSGLVCLHQLIQSPKNKYLLILSGIFLGLSLQAKSIYLLGVIIPVGLVLFFAKDIWKSKRIRYAATLLFLLFLPTLIFELYRFITLASEFGLKGYWGNNIDIRKIWEVGGSGLIILMTGVDLRFVYNKLGVWKHIGVDPFIFATPLFVLAPFLRKKESFLFLSVFLSSAMFFVWFCLLSSTGWFRHVFPGIVMGMICISGSLNAILESGIQTKKIAVYILLVLFLSQIYVGLISGPLSLPNIKITKERLNRIYKSPPPNKMQGPLYAVFSKKNQQEVASFIQKNVPLSKRICYYRVLVAEIPVIANRVFFPVERCRQDDVVIIGPYQKGFFTQDTKIFNHIKNTICKKWIFSNDEYALCSL